MATVTTRTRPVGVVTGDGTGVVISLRETHGWGLEREGAACVGWREAGFDLPPNTMRNEAIQRIHTLGTMSIQKQH